MGRGWAERPDRQPQSSRRGIASDRLLARRLEYLRRLARFGGTMAEADAITYTCPMHPQIVRDRPGVCPICGMALEPRNVQSEDDENPELADMSRRFWVGLVLSVPLFLLAMSDVLPA